MNGLVIENWPITRFRPYDRNPRTHSRKAVEGVAALLRQFGFRFPVVAKSDGELIDGHLRLKAATKIGIKTIPVALADDMTEAQIKAFRVAVNKSAEWASWDDDKLAVELEELGDMNFDLGEIGIDVTDFAFAPIGDEDNQAAPARSEPDGADASDDDEEQSGDGATQPSPSNGEGAAAGAKPAKDPKSRYPIMVEMNHAQFQKWKALKKAAEIKGDSEAFLHFTGISDEH